MRPGILFSHSAGSNLTSGVVILRRGARLGSQLSDRHFAVQLSQFIPGFLSYSVAVFLK
jgi:hypothetical protein